MLGILLQWKAAVNAERTLLLDFGLAKQSRNAPLGDATQSMGITQAGRVMGTPADMSPEQAKPADARSDIFSFGALLYEILSGRRASTV
jgi:serine/threonine protein kinase